jgi:hypothetical protein
LSSHGYYPCNSVTNCYNAFAGLLIVVSLPDLSIPENPEMAFAPGQWTCRY